MTHRAKETYLLLCFVVSVQSAFGAPFTNLGFDSGTTNSSTIAYNPDTGMISGFGPAADLLPGWQLVRGTTRDNLAGYNSVPAIGGSGDYATLVSQSAGGIFQFPVEGSFALQLNGAGGLTLQQQGGIPSDAQYLTVLEVGRLGLKLNNTDILPAQTRPWLTPTTIVYDISSYAGQSVDLEIYGVGNLDSLVFVVPEPSTWALFVVGGLGLLYQRLRRCSPRTVGLSSADTALTCCMAHRTKETYLLFVLLASIQSAFGTPFQNLDFDAGTTSIGSGSVADLLPGWQLFYGTNQVNPVTMIGINSFPLDGPNATLISQDASAFYRFRVEGSYAMLIDRGIPRTTLFSLHQQGDIPVGVKYLTIRESGGRVTVNNTDPPWFYGNPNDGTEIVYDISSFAGQNVDLGLTGDYSIFDSLAFIVPEPSTWALFVVGGSGLLYHRLRRCSPR